MKRHLLATLAFLMLLPLSACAQWYLFPGSGASRDSTAATRRDTVIVNRGDVIIDSVLVSQRDTLFFDIPIDEEERTAVTKVSLILPMKSTATPNSNFLDFYCGVLMAADELSSEERRYELTVYDSTVEMPSALDIEMSDLVIGPVNYDDMLRILPRTRGKYIISPLDPKVAPLTETHNVIQAPAGWGDQVDELVRWLSDDLRGGDAVVLLQSVSDKGGEITDRMAKKMGEAGIAYTVSSEPESMEGAVRGTCRFVIASENDEFCASAIREIALMNLRGGRNSVYSTSKLRSLSDLEVESLHAAATRITASYYADPKSAEVVKFAERYRKLFKGEPGQWVYQGYDLMKYFGALQAAEPELWFEEIAATPGSGLQTDFRFDYTGKNNTAVRRLRYNSDNTISIIR
jgi:hypothetical protein